MAIKNRPLRLRLKRCPPLKCLFFCVEYIIILDVTNDYCYYCLMIRSFKSKKAEKIWFGEFLKKLPADIQKIMRRKLRMLNNSTILSDLLIPPSNNLEQLKGDRKGQHSIKVNDQWRICFGWKDGDCYNVEIVDYH